MMGFDVDGSLRPGKTRIQGPFGDLQLSVWSRWSHWTCSIASSGVEERDIRLKWKARLACRCPCVNTVKYLSKLLAQNIATLSVQTSKRMDMLIIAIVSNNRAAAHTQ